MKKRFITFLEERGALSKFTAAIPAEATIGTYLKHTKPENYILAINWIEQGTDFWADVNTEWQEELMHTEIIKHSFKQITHATAGITFNLAAYLVILITLNAIVLNFGAWVFRNSGWLLLVAVVIAVLSILFRTYAWKSEK